MKVVFDETFFDEIDHFHPNFDESVPNRWMDQCPRQEAVVKLKFLMMRMPLSQRSRSPLG